MKELNIFRPTEFIENPRRLREICTSCKREVCASNCTRHKVSKKMGWKITKRTRRPAYPNYWRCDQLEGRSMSGSAKLGLTPYTELGAGGRQFMHEHDIPQEWEERIGACEDDYSAEKRQIEQRRWWLEEEADTPYPGFGKDK